MPEDKKVNFVEWNETERLNAVLEVVNELVDLDLDQLCEEVSDADYEKRHAELMVYLVETWLNYWVKQFLPKPIITTNANNSTVELTPIE